MEKSVFAAAVFEDAIIRLIAGLRPVWIVCLAWGTVLLAVQKTCAEDELIWSGPGCVLLKNGNVLSAIDVVPQGKQLAIRLDETGDIRIPIKDVVAVGHNPLELYYYQVSKTKRWGAGEHWQLAKWCLRQGLVEQSRIHYDQLKAIGIDQAKFRQLDSELKQVLLQDPVMKAALNSAFPSEAVSSASHTATKEVDSSTHPKTTPRQSNASPNARRDSSTLATNIDRAGQDYFRMHIQPFLAMRCGQAGCHGAYGKSDFHVAKGGVLHGQRSIEISLDSAAKFLDHENSEATTLWIKATTAHGSQGAPSLTNKNAAERDLLNRLRYWHQAVHRSNAVVTMSAMSQVDDQLGLEIAAKETTNRSSAKKSPEMGAFENEGKADSSLLLPKSEGKLPEIGNELLMLEREIAKLEEKERARTSSKRHDPEEFNRRYNKASP